MTLSLSDKEQDDETKEITIATTSSNSITNNEQKDNDYQDNNDIPDETIEEEEEVRSPPPPTTTLQEGEDDENTTTSNNGNNNVITMEQLIEEMNVMNEKVQVAAATTNKDNATATTNAQTPPSPPRSQASRTSSFTKRSSFVFNRMKELKTTYTDKLIKRWHSTGELTNLEAVDSPTSSSPLSKQSSNDSTTADASSCCSNSDNSSDEIDDDDIGIVSPWSINCTGLKILFLSSDTGGGHRASAESLANYFQLLYPGSEYILEDIMTNYAPRPYKNLKAWYAHLSKHPNQWNIVYKVSNTNVYQKLQRTHCNAVAEKSIRKRIQLINPDVIISVHPLMNSVPVVSCRNIIMNNNKGNANTTNNATKYIPMYTVVTDLGSAHTSWFDKDVDNIFIASPQIYNIATSKPCNIPPSKLIMSGLPIRNDFLVQSEKLGDRLSPQGKKYQLQIRNELGLDVTSSDTKVVLVMGGGEGCGALSTIVTELHNELNNNNLKTKSQIIVICGRNDKLKNELCEKYNNNSTTDNTSIVQVMPLGFVNEMAKYMIASNILVSKAGPGTIAEAASLSLPIMLTSFLPGQEEGNVDYVIGCSSSGSSRSSGETVAAGDISSISSPSSEDNDDKFGSYISDKYPNEIAKEVVKWLLPENSHIMEKLVKNAKLKGRPTAAKDIVSTIGKSVTKWKILNGAQELIDEANRSIQKKQTLSAISNNSNSSTSSSLKRNIESSPSLLLSSSSAVAAATT